MWAVLAESKGTKSLLREEVGRSNQYKHCDILTEAITKK